MSNLPARISAHCALLTLALPATALVAQTATRNSPQPIPASLPIRRVALYKNGVGFFEHIGTVHGNESVTIDFTTAQLNDVLQTLTAVDLAGGHITGADYNSTTPLEQQLRSLPLSLSGDASAADFYTAIRGARVEVTGAGAPVTGRILNLELRSAAPPKAGGESAPATEKSFLTVVSDAGAVRTVELGTGTSVRMLDADLHNNVNRYLETLAGNRGSGLRHLTLADHGAGSRELRVSYISEVPVWKSTYRILFDKSATTTAQTATLQGWAVVDNTVGADWKGVQLSLIAGAPQSFLQPISQPYYNRRPEVGLPQEAQLTPQTHESGQGLQQVQGVAGAGIGSAGATMGGIADGIPGSLGLAGSPVPVVRSGSGSGGGIGAGQGSAFGSPTRTNSGTNSSLQANQTVAVNGRQEEIASLSAPSPIAYEQTASASVAPNTTTASFDDFFEYKLSDPVTIRKNESALVPILQTKVAVDPVTLWSPSQATPLRALWITNTSQLTLDRGSFSILENGNFSGQGLLDPIHPGERRLLSYAADQAVRVSEDLTGQHNGQTRRVQQITIAQGVLMERAGEVAEKEYLIHNAAPEARTVIIEQPRQQGWDLDSETKPEETTPTLYRFRVATKANESTHLHLRERRLLYSNYQIANTSPEQITLMLQQDGNPPAVLAALEPIFEKRRRLAILENQIALKTAEINTIAADQNRLRQNMTALKGSTEERALVRRYTAEMNTQEDRLAVLRSEIAALQVQQSTTQSELNQAIQQLSLSVDLS